MIKLSGEYISISNDPITGSNGLWGLDNESAIRLEANRFLVTIHLTDAGNDRQPYQMIVRQANESDYQKAI